MHNGIFTVDGHADILYRMGEEKLSFYDADSVLHQSYSHLRASGVDLQVFVTFVMPNVTPSEQLYQVLASLHRFTTQVERVGAVRRITTVQQLDEQVLKPDGSIGALLSLEGADALNGQIAVLHALFGLGVRLIGLTWNGANCVADGVGESRGAGLTQFGRDVVSTMQELGMVVDVSHLAARGVWDVLDMTHKPVIASHSNAQAVHLHQRNLTDDQIRAIAQTGGVVGATFVPAFIGSETPLTSDHLLKHIDHLLSVAGENGVALGSDFDGIEKTLADLRSGEDYPRLYDLLEARFGANTFAKMAGGNLLRVLRAILPTT
ncbi:MAG: dipeptidase [Firmicutes bacterium]|nr:dipeptidase [Bacillota bacterium]